MSTPDALYECGCIPLKRGLRSEAVYSDTFRKGDKVCSGRPVCHFLTRAMMCWRGSTRPVTVIAKSMTPQKALIKTRLVLSQPKVDSKEGVREDLAMSCDSQAPLSRSSVESS